MKRALSRQNAANLKRIYVKTEFDCQLVVEPHNRKSTMFDILTKCEQLPKFDNRGCHRTRSYYGCS